MKFGLRTQGSFVQDVSIVTVGKGTSLDRLPPVGVSMEKTLPPTHTSLLYGLSTQPNYVLSPYARRHLQRLLISTKMLSVVGYSLR